MGNGKTVTSVGCPSTGKDEPWKLNAYPNCNSLNFGADSLSLVLSKKGSYYIGGLETNPTVEDIVVDISTIRPIDIKEDLEKPIENAIHGGGGRADDSTAYINEYSILSKTSIRAYFKQTFDGDSLSAGYYKDWANPGARQMWWYSALQFKLEATTYRYKDKRLVVEWQPEDEDVNRSTIHVRHMVRSGSNGGFVKTAEHIIPLTDSLPLVRTLEAEPVYGKPVGRNISYISYSNTVQTGSSVTANLSKNQDTAYVTFFYEVEPPKFTGDFDIVPDTINFRDSFSFVPKNFVMNGCVYQSHRYKIERDGTFTSAIQTGGQSQATTYSYGKYPWIIGVGTHIVSINIKTNCGETGWINPKPLVVNDMAGNNPPQFKVGFVYPTAQTIPIYKVVEGTVLNLIYIEDDTVPTPFDPDGDDIYFMGFDTEGSISKFIRDLPVNYAHSEYGNGYHRITMDTVGYHYVTAQMRDQWGATSTASTWIQVVPKNPVAVPEGPTKVKSGRPVKDAEFSSTKSYSPVGRKIDHTRDEWTNKEEVYYNDTNENIFERVELHVYDSVGLRSLDPGIHNIIVEPDLPPIAKLDVPALAVRNQEAEIINRSYSPDGDELVEIEYKYKYDAENNGFDDDEWKTATGGSAKVLPFKPSKVGKYLFYVKVTEDYGQWDDTLDEDQELLVMNVVNDAPTISFDMEGKNEQPDLEPLDPYWPKDILKQWKLYQVNSNSLMQWPSLKWSSDGRTLAGSTGKMNETQTNLAAFHGQSHQNWAYPFQNFGLGYNNLSPYRAIDRLNSAKSQPLLTRSRGGSGTWEPIDYTKYDNSLAMEIRSNESHFYFNEASKDRGGSTYFPRKNPRLYAFNKAKAGRYTSVTQMPDNNPYDMYLEHIYQDGIPYDFVLGPEHLRNVPKPTVEQYSFYDYTSMRNNDLTRATYRGTTTIQNGEISGYKVAEKTIYQSVGWDCYRVCSYYYDDGSAEYDSTIPDIIAYDAFTGEFLSSAFMNGSIDRRKGIQVWTTKGDNLIGLYDGSIVELNRKGKIVETYPNFVKPRSTQYDRYNVAMSCQSYIVKDSGYSDLFLEGVDAWYVFESTGCYPDDFNFYRTLSLVKVWKDDLTVAWRTDLKAYFMSGAGSLIYQMGNMKEYHQSVMINEMKGEIVVRSFKPNGFGLENYAERIDIATGAISYYNADGSAPFNSYSTTIEMDWNGNYYGVGQTTYPNILTADGWKTKYSGTKESTIWNPANVRRSSFSSDMRLSTSWAANVYLYQGTHGFYVGDGMYVTVSSAYNTNNGNFVPILHVGEPTQDPLIYDAFTLGQWVSDSKLKNAELAFSMALYQPKVNNKLAGMSFRMQNPLNRYAVETDGAKLYLTKYTGGNRTILGEQHFPVQAGKAYKFRILMQGEAIKVYMDGVPYFEVTDSQYEDGTFGMFSDRGLVDFDQIGSKELPDPNVWDTQYAIWEEEDAAATIRTDNVIFEDPENDPIAKLDWSIFHTVRFINNQGLSSLHGQSITEGELKLDHVGDYKVALRGKDDPHPDYLMPDETFGEYRKDSNEFVRMITVHRRPIAQFEVEQRERDGQVLWNDSSYDPDRYESPTLYSDEITGIDYKATKGIMEKRFYYITPNGDYVPEKLITPQEKGAYEIGLAVKDEYGAWSNWAVRMLDIDKLPPPNTPPVPGFTKTQTTTYRGVNVTINSTAYDLEDGDRTNLPHTYYARNITKNGAETIRSTSRTNWTIAFDQLGTYNIRQLVQDSHGATAQTEQSIAIVNRKPVANITYPTSANQNHPTKVDVLRPEFSWTYSDADKDAQARYQVQIYRYGGYLLLDSGSQVGAGKAWTASADLPEYTNMYVQVRVHDGYDWSDWSTVRYFYIETNRPPIADFSWAPRPTYEGDTVQFVSDVTDPDRDTLSVLYELTDPNQTKTVYSYSFQPNGTLYPTTAPKIRMVQTGNWTMKLTVSDGKADPVVVTKTVAVLPLGIAGGVKHTALWDDHRRSYNKKQSGNEESPRGYEVFWAGEKFILVSDTTSTGTETKAERVEATFGNYKADLKAVREDRILWQGELWDSAFQKLNNGRYSFVFTVTYNNGTIKSDIVEIIILGDAAGIAGVHRVQ